MLQPVASCEQSSQHSLLGSVALLMVADRVGSSGSMERLCCVGGAVAVVWADPELAWKVSQNCVPPLLSSSAMHCCVEKQICKSPKVDCW